MSMLDHDNKIEALEEKRDSVASDILHDGSLMFRNGHISLFGEIIHDLDPIVTEDLHPDININVHTVNDEITTEDGISFVIILKIIIHIFKDMSTFILMVVCVFDVYQNYFKR